MSKCSSGFDKRCPRKLEDFPSSSCPLAVKRLKAIRYSNKELSEEEEASLGGCEWAVSHQLASYCFFKYMSQYAPTSRSLSDMEIAHMCSIPTEAVKKIEKKAINKLKNSPYVVEISSVYDGEQVFTEQANKEE
jgi:hypothetical protein